MKTVIDTFTGRQCSWNSTVRYCGFVVPALHTANDAWHLHPSRVPLDLLRQLNSDKTDAEIHAIKRLAT